MFFPLFWTSIPSSSILETLIQRYKYPYNNIFVCKKNDILKFS